MTELKPCPFCGGEAEVSGSCGYSILCSTCEASVGQPFNFCEYDGVFDTFEEAAIAWNTRAERTCKPETEVLDTVDIGIGLLERVADKCSDCGEQLTCDYSSNAPWRRVLPNYCPSCGAKVVGD